MRHPAPRRPFDWRSLRRRIAEVGGFTLIEMMVALLILAIVLAATAPAFYSTLKATSTTDFRSVANGIAVQANEQLRSLPYYELGYHSFPGTCSAPTGFSGTPSAATLAQNGPMDDTTLFRLTKTVDGKTFSIQRCPYWVGASDNTTQSYAGAYIATTVTVSWTDQTGTQSVTQSSIIYPGGEGAWSGAEDSFPPSTEPTETGATPTAPTGLTLSSTRANSVDVSWTAPTTATKSTNYTYLVEYNTTGDFDGTLTGLYAYTSTTKTSATISGLALGSKYYFQIVAVNNGAEATSTLSSIITYGTPSTSGTCTIYSMTVNPTQAQLDTYGYLSGQSFFSVGMSVSPGCTNGNSTVWAYFPTSSSTLQSVQLTGPSAMLTGAAGLNPDGTQMQWTPGNKTFTAYASNGSSSPTAYSPSTYVQVNICQASPVTGKCP